MKNRILVKAPALSRSGYGEQARFALRALRTREDVFDIYIINIPWGKTGMIMENTPERKWIDEMMLKTQLHTQQGGTFDASLQITIPNEFEPIAPYNVGYTAGIETTKVAPEWIEKCNTVIQRLVTISKHSRDVFRNTTYTVTAQDTGEEIPSWGLNPQLPVEVVNYPTRLTEPEPLDIEFETTNNFLVVSQWGPRKNMENTIRWFAETFKDDPTAGLVIKTSIACDSIRDRYHTGWTIDKILRDVPQRKCKIYMVHGEVTLEQLTWLYQHPTMKALINIAHGEGYGLPMFEAAYNGLPLVTMPWSGQMDYICRPNKKGKNFPRIIKVDYDINQIQKSAVWNGVLQEDSMWAYAKEASFKRALQEAITKEKHYKKEALALQKHILKNFEPQKMYEEFVESLGIPLQSTVEKAREALLQIENPKDRAAAATTALAQFGMQSDKLALLKDLFKGEKCYLLSCGPTLTEHDEDTVKGLLENNLMLAVKQSYDLFASFTDFHVYNCANYKKYDYAARRPVVMEASTTPFKLGECDLKFFIRERNFDNSLSCRKNFDDWTLEKQGMLRPYGPGIIYEAAFYLLQHLGVSEIITIGWDNKLIPAPVHQQHFYDREGSPYNKADFIHSNEVAANEAACQTISHEEKITLDAAGEWYDWLKQNGCELKIISRLNSADDRIERIEL